MKKNSLFLFVFAAMFFIIASVVSFADDVTFTTVNPNSSWANSGSDIYATNSLAPAYGNVGIGTSNPYGPLHVKSLLSMWGAIFEQYISFYNSGAATDKEKFWSIGASLLNGNQNIFYMAAVEAIPSFGKYITGSEDIFMEVIRRPGDYHIDTVSFPSGNIVIGPTAAIPPNPTERLEINGNTKIITGTGTLNIKNYGSNSVELLSSGPLVFYPDSSASANTLTVQKYSGTSINLLASGNLVFSVDGAGIGSGCYDFKAGNNSAMYIDASAGRVGIGTSTPSAELSIGQKILFSNSTNPGNPPSGSVIIYFDGTNLQCKNSSGTVKTVAKFQ